MTYKLNFSCKNKQHTTQIKVNKRKMRKLKRKSHTVEIEPLWLSVKTKQVEEIEA
jgi:hypothetical protein